MQRFYKEHAQFLMIQKEHFNDDLKQDLILMIIRNLWSNSQRDQTNMYKINKKYTALF